MRSLLMNLGCKIREIRKARKLTLQELAVRTGLTAGLLSKIENFRTVPSLPVLLDIAQALKVDLSKLFDGISMEKKRNWVLVHRSDYQPVEREPKHGLQYQMALEMPIKAVNMQLMLVTEGKNEKYHPVTTEADQLLCIISGSFRFRVGDDCIDLQPGDILFFDGTIPHGPDGGQNSSFSFFAFYFLRAKEGGVL